VKARDREDLFDLRLVVDERHGAPGVPGLLQRRGQHGERGAVEVGGVEEIHDDPCGAAGEEFLDGAPQLRRGVDIQLPGHVDDGNAVRPAQAQLDFHGVASP